MPQDPSRAKQLVGEPRQLASVRRVIIADGADAGVEALVFSTGGGLDFWVTVGRMMDIAALSWRGTQLAWQSPAGWRPIPAAAPQARSRHTFNAGLGGFLNSCGFDHIRQPVGDSPLHGSAPFTPARLLTFGEDWDGAQPLLFCEGEVVAWSYGVGGHRMRRRIEAPIFGASLRICDTIEVVGPQEAPLLALYHFNLGYPLVRKGTRIHLDGKPLAGPLDLPEEKASPATLHAASPDRSTCRVWGTHAPVIEFSWRTDTLPWLQIWRDLRQGCGVLSIEPCTTGRRADGSNEPSPLLAAGQRRSFEIEVVLSGSPVA